MPNVERQLRDYFDAGVERMSVEDVMAQAAVRETRLEPLRTRRSLKPAWAAVGAFAATIAAIGGVVGLIAGAQTLTGGVGTDMAEIVSTSGGTVGAWLVAGFVAALVAAAVTWMIRRPPDEAEQEAPDEGKVMVMETIEQTDADVGRKQITSQSNRWPTVAMAVLAIAVVGLVAWMVFAMRPTSPNAAPAGIQQLMEDYSAAWNAQDPDALEALVTDTYRAYGPDIGGAAFDHDMESVRTYLMPLLAESDWQVTEPGPVYAVSDGGIVWYVSTEGSTITRDGSDHAQNGVWTVVDRNGEFLVDEHFMMGG